MKVYIASSLSNVQPVRLLGETLRAGGHLITYDWTDHGAVYRPGAPPATNEDAMRRVSELELGGIALADAVIVLLKGGRGTHVEMGAALALNKTVLIVGKEAEHYPGNPCAFYSNRYVKKIETVFGKPVSIGNVDHRAAIMRALEQSARYVSR